MSKPADSTVTTTTTTTEEARTPAQLEQDALAAFDHGLGVADGSRTAKPSDEQDAEIIEELDADGNVIEPVTPAAPAKPAAPKDGEKPPADAPPAEEPKPDVELETEIKTLGLKTAAAERFRSLTTEIKTLREQAATVPQLQERAAAADQFESVVLGTGATEQQFGAALGYLAAVNSGDPAQMKQAFEVMSKELAWLAGEIGVEAPGFDPLDADPDLKDKVKRGAIDREDALRIVQNERVAKLTTASTEKRTAAQQQEDAVKDGVTSVQSLADKLKAEDADNFDAKLAVIGPAIRVIRRTVAPTNWASEIEKLYRETTLPAAAPAPARPAAPSPTRPGSHSSHGVVTKPVDDVDAFTRGLEIAEGKR